MVGKNSKNRWFPAIWVICAAIAGWLYFHWHVSKDYVGLMEIVTHSIGARESGIIREMLVSIKDHVRRGQVLAILDTSEIDTELQLLRRSLEESLALEEANRSRFALEMQRLRLQLDNESSDLSERLAELVSKQAEFSGLNNEINRLQKAETAGLGYNRDLAELILKRDTLSSFLELQEQELGLRKQRSERAGQSRTALDATDDSSVVEAMMAEARDQTNAILKDIIVAENRKQMRTVISPCDGHVVELFARAGDTVEEYLPILSIMESSSAFLNVYIPERSDFAVREGMQVDVYPVRADAPDTTGRIEFIHPGYTQVPERLTVRGQALWAHVVRVGLDSGHQLRPGEIVHVRIDGDNRHGSISGSEAYAETPSESPVAGAGGVSRADIRRPSTSEMAIPPELLTVSRFEPSGIAWLAEVGKHVVVSDDTGIADTMSEHAPMLFLMDRNGAVDPAPVGLHGTDTVNDLESITRIDRDSFIVVSSQNISQKSTRHDDRRMMTKIRYRDGAFQVEAQISLLNIILESLSGTELTALGLEAREEDQLPVLNIEGAAFRDGALYLGLKEPVTRGGAMIWRLSDVESIFATGKLAPEQLRSYGIVNLTSGGKHQAGISDLTFDDKGRLWALSTVPDAGEKEQVGALHRIDRFADGSLKAVTIYEFPGKKPEGLSFDEDGNFMIVFDADQQTPSFLIGKTAAL